LPTDSQLRRGERLIRHYFFFLGFFFSFFMLVPLAMVSPPSPARTGGSPRRGSRRRRFTVLRGRAPAAEVRRRGAALAGCGNGARAL
jgi:hypothetical protein